MNKTKIGIVSGYFNPLHKGHIEYINAAKSKCTYLMCIVNNDDQVVLKGSQVFMDEEHRLLIVKNLKSVDVGVISVDEDLSVSETLKRIVENSNLSRYEFIFFNSGDRSSGNNNSREELICKENGIQMVYIDLPKVCSSSELKLNFATDNVK